jgi:hypothetical protein
VCVAVCALCLLGGCGRDGRDTLRYISALFSALCLCFAAHAVPPFVARGAGGACVVACAILVRRHVSCRCAALTRCGLLPSRCAQFWKNGT